MKSKKIPAGIEQLMGSASLLSHPKFSGSYKITIGKRGRLVFPRPFWDQLISMDLDIIVSRKWQKLLFYPSQVLVGVKKRINKDIAATKFDLRQMVAREFYPYMGKERVSQAGVLFVPPTFLGYLDIEAGQEVTLVGCGDHLEMRLD